MILSADQAPTARAFRGEIAATVLANHPLCRDHFRLTLGLPEFAPTRPGQFVQLCTRSLAEPPPAVEHDWTPGEPMVLRDPDLLGPQTLLRRPFSLAGRRDVARGVELDVIHRVVGVGTQWLSELRPGDAVSAIGPLGNGFPRPSVNARVLLVGGGVGIPPMIYLAGSLGRWPTVAFVGVTTRDLFPLILAQPPDPAVRPNDCVDEFAQVGIASVVTSDDGSLGYRGFVTQALQQYLDDNPATSFEIYTCGPEPMMRRVAALAAERGIPCHVAIERAMACGMGTCQSCCIKVKKANPAAVPLPGRDWAWKLACTDGPVFPADTLIW